MTAELTLTVDVDAPAEVVWEVVTDYERAPMFTRDLQVSRILGRNGDTVRVLQKAQVRYGPLAVTDTMVITEWEPPTRCVVHHTGAVIRGDGIFEVTALGPQRARFLWSELLDLPFGVVGRVGWPIARPLLRVGVARSLRAMARHCETRYRDRG